MVCHLDLSDLWGIWVRRHSFGPVYFEAFDKEEIASTS